MDWIGIYRKQAENERKEKKQLIKKNILEDKKKSFLVEKKLELEALKKRVSVLEKEIQSHE